jgi:hypothetical protein
MRFLKTIFILLALAPRPVWAAGCASKDEAVALKVAALRQQLISAALSCHEGAAYHAMAMRHRSELAASDATLKTFFAPRGGPASYTSFKNKAATLSLQLQARDGTAFCADMRTLFTALESHGPNALIAARGTSDAGNICRQFPLVPISVRVPEPIPAPRISIPIHLVKAVPVKPFRAASIRTDLPRIAAAEPLPQQVADDPVPPRPPRSWMRPRTYAESRPTGDGWYERSYGPPPGWYPPPPRPRWYSREEEDE